MSLDGLKDRLIAAIAARRQARGETNYEALAGEVGRTAERVRQWATGEDLPPLGVLPQVCSALGITPEYLLFGIPPKSQTNVTGRTIGARIKARRGELGMSQTMLAKLTGLAQPTICELEQDRSAGTAHIIKLADALRVEPRWLESGAGAPPETPTLPADLPPHVIKIAEKLAVVSDDKLKAVATLLGIKL